MKSKLILTVLAFSALLLSAADVSFDGKKTIFIEGKQSLKSIAEALNNPALFSYDAAAKKAVTTQNLRLNGVLTMDGETLAIASNKQKLCFTILPRKGALLMKKSKICSADGSLYDIAALGKLVAEDSVFDKYGANSSLSFRLERLSDVVLKNCALSGRYVYVTTPAAKLVIEGCDFTGCEQNFRLLKDVTVEAVDCKNITNCSLVPGSLILWRKSVVLTLLDKSGKPISGAQIFLQSANRNGIEAAYGPVVTDAKGQAVVRPVWIDTDAGGNSSFYRTVMRARINGENHLLIEKFRPKQTALTLKQNDKGFAKYE